MQCHSPDSKLHNLWQSEVQWDKSATPVENYKFEVANNNTYFGTNILDIKIFAYFGYLKSKDAENLDYW